MKRPSNVVVEAGTNVTLECSSLISPSNITWRHESVGDIGDHCTSSDPRFITTSTGHDCYLTALGNYRIQGLYGCGDEGGQYAEAVVIVIGKLVLLRVSYSGKDTLIIVIIIIIYSFDKRLTHRNPDISTRYSK